MESSESSTTEVTLPSSSDIQKITLQMTPKVTFFLFLPKMTTFLFIQHSHSIQLGCVIFYACFQKRFP